jgi:hypothetical protein
MEILHLLFADGHHTILFCDAIPGQLGYLLPCFEVVTGMRVILLNNFCLDLCRSGWLPWVASLHRLILSS